MYIFHCRICEQDFDEIPNTAFMVGGKGPYRMYRFQDGTIHDIRRFSVGSLDKLEVVSVAPVTEKLPVSTLSPPIETLMEVDAIEESSIAEPNVEEIQDPPGEWVDAICTKYERSYGDGMLKMEPQFRRRGDSPRCWLVFRASDIVTFGQIKIGSRVHCLVSEPDYLGGCPRAKEVQIYME